MHINGIEGFFLKNSRPIPLVDMENNVPVLPDRNFLDGRLKAGARRPLENIAELVLPLVRNNQRDFPAGLLLELGINLLVNRVVQGWLTTRRCISGFFEGP